MTYHDEIHDFEVIHQHHGHHTHLLISIEYTSNREDRLSEDGPGQCGEQHVVAGRRRRPWQGLAPRQHRDYRDIAYDATA